MPKPKFLDPQEIFLSADQTREKFSGGAIPVDVDLIAEKLGLDLIPISGFSADLDAFLKVDLSGIIVKAETYGSDRHEARVRFSIAHEIGHFILHKKLISQLEYKSVDDFLGFFRLFSEADYRAFEYQANQFAGRLIVPRDRLETVLKQTVALIPNRQVLELYQKDRDQLLDRMAPSLAKPFGVSEQVVTRRVGAENLWSPDSFLGLLSS